MEIPYAEANIDMVEGILLESGLIQREDRLGNAHPLRERYFVTKDPHLTVLLLVVNKSKTKGIQVKFVESGRVFKDESIDLYGALLEKLRAALGQANVVADRKTSRDQNLLHEPTG